MSRRSATIALAVIAALGVAPLGCSESTRVTIISFSVEPEGVVAPCQEVTLSFTASDRSRWSLTSGSKLLRTGLTTGLPEQISINAEELDPAASTVRLSLATTAGEVSSSASLQLAADNAAPFARPRLATAAQPGAVVRLQGMLSEDPDGDELSYQWSLVTEPEGVDLEQTNEVNALLRLPDRPVVVEVALTVTDARGAADQSRIRVIAPSDLSNHPPDFSDLDIYDVVEAEGGEEVTLEVAVEDPDGQGVRLSWDQVAGPQVMAEITSRGATMSFTAPQSPSLLAFDVTATDELEERTARFEVAVDGAAPDVPPRPSIVAPETADLFLPTTLDGSSTTDPDSEDLFYRWSLISAPAGSLLADDSIPGLEGPEATSIEVIFDVPGRYLFELQVADALGFSPQVERLSIDTGDPIEQVDSGAVAQIECRADLIVWTNDQGVRLLTGGASNATTLSEYPSAAVALVPGSAQLWMESEHDGTTLVVVDLGNDEFSPPLELPEGAIMINDIAVDPAPTRLGDLYVGTNAGTAILDVSQDACENPSGLGCWVGSTSTGYLHSPPSLSDHRSEEVEVLHMGSADEVTVVHMGNRFWLSRLERRDGEHRFSQAVVDLFSDRVPQAITAITTAGSEIYCGAESFGVVRRSESMECGYTDATPTLCQRALGSDCELPATALAPTRVVGLASWHQTVFIASDDGFYHLSSDLNRVGELSIGGMLSGAPTAVAVCGDTLYLGTSEGLWRMPLMEVEG